jgi:hypothetical protein
LQLQSKKENFAIFYARDENFMAKNANMQKKKLCNAGKFNFAKAPQ